MNTHLCTQSCAPSRRQPWHPRHSAVAKKISARRCLKMRTQAAVGQQRTTLADDLVQRYRVLQDPAGHDTRYVKALQDFTRSSILAFECNWSEASLERELADHPECGLFCCIIWLTLLQLPRQTVARLQLPSSAAAAVFGYLEKRWAWYNLERLQLEILVSSGRRVPPAAVAELAQLVYTTLHQVAPQWAD